MTKKQLPKSSVSKALPLEQALRAFDAKRHGGELMAGPPVGNEALPKALAYAADEGPLSTGELNPLDKIAAAALPKGRALGKRSLS